MLIGEGRFTLEIYGEDEEIRHDASCTESSMHGREALQGLSSSSWMPCRQTPAAEVRVHADAGRFDHVI